MKKQQAIQHVQEQYPQLGVFVTQGGLTVRLMHATGCFTSIDVDNATMREVVQKWLALNVPQVQAEKE